MDPQIKSILKTILSGFLILLTIASLFALMGVGVQKDKTISLSTLARDINDQKVKKMVVEGPIVTVEYNDGATKTTRKESESALTQQLKDYNVDPSKMQMVDLTVNEQKESAWSWVSSLLFILLPVIFIAFFFWMMFKQNKAGAGQIFDFSQAKAKLFDNAGKPKFTFDDIGGLKEAKEELEEMVDFLKNPQKFTQIGARVPRGVLLVGPTGTGKTLIAKAVASQANVPFFSISGSEFIELFVGVGAARVRDLFAKAKRFQPSIIFIDELDAIGGVRSPGFGGGHEEREQTLNQILVEMDGFDRESTCIVLAATNRPDILDPALLRPGRFDRRVVFDLPDVNSRKEILKIHCKNKQMEGGIKLDEIAERTPGFSGADLANLVNEAALLAVKKKKLKISQNELFDSIEKVLLGPERKSHLLSTDEKEIAAYHEAGHAVVNTFVPAGQMVRKISIISRGNAGGYTLTLPKEEKRFKTKTEFVSEIATLFGGYCAEQLIYNQVTTGATNDLEVASDIARSLVKEFGMSDLGPITFGLRSRSAYLRNDMEDQNYSEKVAERIDAEVEKIITQGKEEAVRILRDKKALLEKIAKILIEKETIEKEEFEDLIKDQKPAKLKTFKKPISPL